MTTFAVIDVGTNSVKLLVARVVRKKLLALRQEIRITRLGEGLHRSRKISSRAGRRTLKAVWELSGLARKYGALECVAVGTRALRAAGNTKEFLRACERETGAKIRVLSGSEEARLGFKAAALAAPARRIAAIDIGGGSTEIMIGSRHAPERSWSLPLGAVVLKEKYLKHDPPTPEERQSLTEALTRRFLKIPAAGGRDLIGIGGTVSTLAALLGRRKNYSYREVAGLAEELALLPSSRIEKRGVERGRADIIAAGALILCEAMRTLKTPILRPCPYGLRHAVLLEMESCRRR